MGPMTTKQMATSGYLHKDAAEMQAQYANSNFYEPSDPTMRSLLEVANHQLDSLQKEIEKLGGMLSPVRSAIPCGIGQEAANYSGDPELIGTMRYLIDRLAQQAATVRNISEELRI